MVFEHQVACETQADAIAAIAPKIGCIPQTLREWVNQAEKDSGMRDANWLREVLSAAKIKAVIPPKSNRLFPTDFERETCKWRHLIEDFFQKIKEYRGIAICFCKTDTSYEALISLIATVIRFK